MSKYLSRIDALPDLAALGKHWITLVESDSCGYQTLATAGLKKYFSGLRTLCQPGTQKVLLPCNFETYAFCVEEILQQLSRLTFNETIKVFTILSYGIKRWYNLSEEHKPGLDFAYTRPDWERYKKNVSSIAHHSGSLPNIQIRRIVAPYNDADLSNYYVYTTHDGDAISSTEARKVMSTCPGCLKILSEISNSITDGQGNRILHILASHDCTSDACCTPKHSWVPLLADFKDRFHTGVHDKYNMVDEDKSGVFCGFVNINDAQMQEFYGNAPKYDDIFVVDMSSVNAGTFGIAFYRDKQEYFSGMVILKDNQIKSQMKTLDKLWIEAAK
jgi:hypothetical protein